MPFDASMYPVINESRMSSCSCFGAFLCVSSVRIAFWHAFTACVKPVGFYFATVFVLHTVRSRVLVFLADLLGVLCSANWIEYCSATVAAIRRNFRTKSEQLCTKDSFVECSAEDLVSEVYLFHVSSSLQWKCSTWLCVCIFFLMLYWWVPLWRWSFTFPGFLCGFFHFETDSPLHVCSYV